jgi:hypothetical protein
VTIIEGESLVNDATALIAFKYATAAVVTGSFSLAEAGANLVLGAVAGVAIGLAVGWVVARIREPLDDPTTEISISLVTPYLAYLPAETLGASAVLAAVTSGIYLGWHSPRLISAPTRIQAFAVWRVLAFVPNSVLFVLVGLTLRAVIDGIAGIDAATLAVYAVVVSLTVIVTRLAWVFPFTYLPRLLFRRVRERDPSPSWREPLIVGWTGMRGAVSLAAALAIPLETDAGAVRPARPDHLPDRRGDLRDARAAGAVPALAHPPRRPAGGGRRRARVQGPARRRPGRAAPPGGARARGVGALRDRAAHAQPVRVSRAALQLAPGRRRRRRDRGRLAGLPAPAAEVLEAERGEVMRLRNEGRIDEETMRRIERDLDLDDTRLEIGPAR